MRLRVIGAALTILGLLVLLFAPVTGPSGYVICGSFDLEACGVYRTDLWGLVHWPAGLAHNIAIPMLIIGAALAVTGIVFLVRARRSRRTGDLDSARTSERLPD